MKFMEFTDFGYRENAMMVGNYWFLGGRVFIGIFCFCALFLDKPAPTNRSAHWGDWIDRPT
jgi:hypothetical protein